jgi:hypothetical protein
MVFDLDTLQKKNTEFEAQYNKKSEKLLVEILIRGLNRIANMPNNEGLVKLRQALYQVDKKVLVMIEDILQKNYNSRT